MEFHKDFQKYFNQIIDMIIPADYMDNKATLEDYINILLELIRLQNKES